MGVFRLESFYENSCNPKTVNIKTLLEEYRKENNYEETQEVIIVVDGTNCLRALYGDLEWVPGGQLVEFHERAKKMVDKFREMHVRLVFFFDGPTVERKRQKWIERRVKTMNDCRRVFYALDTHRYVRQEQFILPPGVGNVARIFLQLEYDCEVHTSVKENDEEISLFAKKNNCFGILAQDTDFMIYEGPKYYFSMKKLNLNTMETITYCRDNLASQLGIKVEQLPLFATLSGNDVVPRYQLQDFHRRICKKNHYNTQYDIANYIKALEIDGEISDEIYNKIASDVMYRKPRVKDRKTDDKKSSDKREEKKKEDGEEKKEEEGGEKTGEEGEDGKKEEDKEDGGGGGDTAAEKMESEEVREEVPEEKKDSDNEKMEVEEEKEKRADGEEKEKVAENGEKKAAEECAENSPEHLEKVANFANVLKTAVESYRLDETAERDEVVIDDLLTDELKDCEEWKNILTVALERHRAGVATTHIWAVLTGGAFELSCCLEDFYKKDLPLGAELTTNLRRRIYGILLMEKPLPADQTCHKVLEWCVDRSFRNNPKAKHLEVWPPKVYDHPGLLALWNSSPDDEEINNKRWNLFARSISTNIDINEVKKLEPFLVAPTMALKYMVENLGYYHDFEIKVMIAMALRVKNSTAEQLAATKPDRIHERPVRLASLYMRVQGFILFLISTLNGPIPLQEVLPWNNFDGKMFQFLYNRSISSCSDSFLCNKNEKFLEQYNAVLKLVSPIKQKANYL